ncbi:hypothetical protein C8R47DRAFT_1225994 [Mycena vitilis]|nr:hypothetical protein C8R47DRAFT_1225994 [Mycena vitilis]
MPSAIANQHTYCNLLANPKLNEMATSLITGHALDTSARTPVRWVHLDYSVRLAGNATGEEIAKATTVLCEAFGWRFFTDALNGDPDLVPEILGAYLKAGLVGGQVYFAENARKEIVGVAVWFQPGHSALGTEEQKAAGWNALMAKLPEKYRSWWIYFLDFLYDGFVEDTLGRGVMLKSFHLQLIGVHPDHQRRGIARKMMGLVEQAREPGTLCVLETPSEEKAKIVYKSLGYEIRDRSKEIKDVEGKPVDWRFYVLVKN